jgi:hypothetical protein
VIIFREGERAVIVYLERSTESGAVYWNWHWYSSTIRGQRGPSMTVASQRTFAGTKPRSPRDP